MDEGLQYTRRARLRALLLLAVVLVVGMLLGAAEERYRGQRASTTPAGPHRHDYPGALGHMDLTSSQRAAIDSLLDHERPRNEAIMLRVLPDLRSEADSLRAAIRAVLTPEQQRTFDREPHLRIGSTLPGTPALDSSTAPMR
jgi:Spy/CpxP family protein refolding chaperone